MSTRNELKIVDMIELASNLVAKKPAGTTRRHCPSTYFLRVTPDQIAEGAFVRDLLSASDDTNLINGADFGAKTTVNTENLSIDDCGEDHEVEDLATGLPDGSITVLLVAFFVEAIDLGDLTRLVIATDQGYAIRVTKNQESALIGQFPRSFIPNFKAKQ